MTEIVLHKRDGNELHFYVDSLDMGLWIRLVRDDQVRQVIDAHVLSTEYEWGINTKHAGDFDAFIDNVIELSNNFIKKVWGDDPEPDVQPSDITEALIWHLKKLKYNESSNTVERV